MDSFQVAFVLNHRQQASFPDITERTVPHAPPTSSAGSSGIEGMSSGMRNWKGFDRSRAKEGTWPRPWRDIAARTPQAFGPPSPWVLEKNRVHPWETSMKP